MQVVLNIFKYGFEAYADHEARVLTHLATSKVTGVRDFERVGPPDALCFPEVFLPVPLKSFPQPTCKFIGLLEGSSRRRSRSPRHPAREYHVGPSWRGWINRLGLCCIH